VGQPAVPALKGMRDLLAGDQTSLADRLLARIDAAIAKAPAVTLARKGRVAWHDLEIMAADPATTPAVAQEAVRGLVAITEGDEAPQALVRLAELPLTPALHAVADPAADDARLILISRRGAAAMQEYAAVARDPKSREGLKMGAINALFGLGRAALPEMEKLAASLPAGPVSSYAKELAATLKTMPAAPAAAVPSQAAKPAGSPDTPCLGGVGFTEIARLPARDLPISPRWFQRSADRAHLIFTTVEFGLYRLVRMKLDGSDHQVLSPLAHQFAPSWSTDGRLIAFLGTQNPIASPGEYSDVYVAAADGRDVRKVTQAPGAYASPVWLGSTGDLLYAANTFASPRTGGAGQTSSLLFRHSLAEGRSTPLLTLTGRIITAIETSPDGRRAAFLSWKVEPPGAGTLYLHAIDADGGSPVEIGLVPAETRQGIGRRFDARRILMMGGDLTWSPDGSRLTTAGRIVDAVAWKPAGRADPDNDAYAAGAVSRTIISPDGACVWFDDTRQIMRRCPATAAPQPAADCGGALLWIDAREGQAGLYDTARGVLGLVRLPPPHPAAP